MMPEIDPGDVVALVALLVSAWTAKKTIDFNKRQNELAETNERLNRLLIDKETAEREAAARADLSANFIKIGKNNWRLKVFNRGPGTASNVRLEMLDDGASDLLIDSDVQRKFPVPILEQHQNIELIAAVTMGSPSRAHLRLVWDDASGKDREKEVTPTI